MLVNFIQEVHKSTERNYLKRMNDDKVHCMEVAREFGIDFFDGDRRYGYGGYKYDGRWADVAKKLATHYNLDHKSTVLDVGCGMGHLGYELERIYGCQVTGLDISQYALDHCALLNNYLFDAGKDKIKGRWDLIISLNTLHNLSSQGLVHALQQIQSHSNNAYIVVESYRNLQEMNNLQCWALTCEQFHRPQDWEWLFKEYGYNKDWEFIYFE